MADDALTIRRRRLLATANNMNSGTVGLLPPVPLVQSGWAFDAGVGGGAQTHNSIIGPQGTLGSTTGVDANDPTLSGPPWAYNFAADAVRFLSFTDALESVWRSTAGFTLIVAVVPSAADLTGLRGVVCKDASAAQIEFFLLLDVGKVSFLVSYSGDFTNADGYLETAGSITATRSTIGITYDRSLARASRAKLYTNGVPVAGITYTPFGIDGTVFDSTSPVRVGQHQRTGTQGLNFIGRVYASPTPAVPNQMLAAHRAIRARGWM